MECKKEKNLNDCACSYSCSKRGICCDCVTFHRKRGEIPGCFFPLEDEKTYDRSVENFIKFYNKSH
ncbi:MAG TPA: DUF6485 family protein [Candidatus Gastranaerophilales bacterium]|nr:DUF6485 family protein [Candidatus Gastranaerophilales bacterium]